jgi:hypothetical protein
MTLLRRLRLRHAAKRYARLGPALSKAYGPSDTYTPGQIRAAISKLGLSPEYSALGYAAFLSVEDYAHIAGNMPFSIPYDEARQLVDRYRSLGRSNTSHFYESGLGMSGGWDAGSS